MLVVTHLIDDIMSFMPVAVVVVTASVAIWIFAVKSSLWGQRRQLESPYAVRPEKTQPGPPSRLVIEPRKDFDWKQEEQQKLRPFKPIYHITMGLRSDDPSELITIDKNYLDRVTLRGLLIRKHNRTVHGCVPGGEDAIAELYTYLLKDYLPRRFPSMFRLSDQGKTFENLVTGRSFTTTPPKDPLAGLRILGTTVEEDLFLMKDTPEGYKTVAFICCFPSGFNPSHKLGKGLKAIHEPVPSFEKIGPSMERFFRKVEVGKNVKRMNWSIQTHPDLFDCDRNHVTNEAQQNVNTKVDLDQTFARMELQTLSRLPETQSLLFSFKTFVYPIREIKEEGSGPDVADAIEGLKAGNAPGMWIYKGGVRWAEQVCEYLRP